MFGLDCFIASIKDRDYTEKQSVFDFDEPPNLPCITIA